MPNLFADTTMRIWVSYPSLSIIPLMVNTWDCKGGSVCLFEVASHQACLPQDRSILNNVLDRRDLIRASFRGSNGPKIIEISIHMTIGEALEPIDLST